MYGFDQPPRSNPPGRPGSCMTPSMDTYSAATTLRISQPFAVVHNDARARRIAGRHPKVDPLVESRWQAWRCMARPRGRLGMSRFTMAALEPLTKGPARCRGVG